MITNTAHRLADALAGGDVATMCAILDAASDDVLAANYTEGRPYLHDVYDAADKAYTALAGMVFGADLPRWLRLQEHGAADTAHALVGWFEDETYRADEAVEIIRCLHADHADGYHDAARDPRNYAANLAYWQGEGCEGCKSV